MYHVGNLSFGNVVDVTCYLHGHGGNKQCQKPMRRTNWVCPGKFPWAPCSEKCQAESDGSHSPKPRAALCPLKVQPLLEAVDVKYRNDK